LVLLFIGWFAFGKSKSVSLEVVAVILLLLAILVTGSRTGLIISLITIVFILGRSGFKEMTKFRNLLKIVMLIILIAGFSFVLKNITADMITGDKSKDELVIRMETMLDFRLSDNETTVEDTSVWHRRLAQLAYLSLINDAPLIGHGFGAETYFLDKGVFPRMSHSDAFSCALHYGILYPLVLSLIIFQLYRKQKKRGAVIPSSSVLNFVVVFLLLYFIAGDMLNDRTLFVVWGMFHAAVYHTHSLSVYDKAHKGHTTLQSLNACPQTCL
jgi:O-antigen ligase